MPSPPTPSPGLHVPFSHAEARALMAELGILSGALWGRITSEQAISGSDRLVPILIEGGGRKPSDYWAFSAAVPTAELPTRRGHGYRVELFGACSIRAYDPQGFEPPSWRYWWMRDPDGIHEIIVQLWRERAFYPHSPLYAELSWHPERGERQAVGGLERLDRRPAGALLLNAWRGFELLKHVRANVGRPLGKTAYATRDSYLAVLRCLHERAAAQRWNLRNAGTCSDEWIAAQLHISKSTLYERNSEYGISMSDIREGKV